MSPMTSPPWFIEARVGADARPMQSSPHSPVDHPYRALAVDDDMNLLAIATITSTAAGETLMDFLSVQQGATVLAMYDRVTQEFVTCAYYRKPQPESRSNA